MKANWMTAALGVTVLGVAASFGLLAEANGRAVLAEASGVASLANSPSASTKQPAQAPAADTYSTATIEAAFGRTKKIDVNDPFFNMVAYTITIPENWVFEGTVLHGPGCEIDYQSYAYRAYSPDAAFGVQFMPVQLWNYWEDKRARPQGRVCKFFAPMSAADYAAMFAYRMRPNAQIDETRPSIGSEGFYADLRQKNQKSAQSARPNTPHEYDMGDATRTRIHYEWEGLSEEEWLGVSMVYRDLPKSVMFYPGNGRPGRADWTHYLKTVATMVSRRAPKGKLDQYDAALLSITRSVTPNPQHVAATDAYGWQQVQRQVQAAWQVTNMINQNIQTQMMINQQNSQALMNTMTQQHQQFMASMQQQGEARHQTFMAQMNAQTAHTRDFQDYILDQQFYMNPRTGETATMSGRYTHPWINGPVTSNGTSVIQTPGNFNPNGVVWGNWTELIPIHH